MLDELADEERPLFLLVHYFDPHFDYRRHPEYGFSSDGAGRLRGNQRIRQLRRMNPQPDDEEMAYLRDVYDEEIRFTDEGIGELIAGLRERNLYDSSVIVLTADHGEEFNEHGWLGHTRNLYEGLIHVPLIFRLPGGEGRGRVIAEPVSLLALAPTVLDAMGFDASDLDFQHGSLMPMLRREETVDPIFVYSEVDFVAGHRPESRSTSMRSVIRGRHKLIHNRNTDRYELYDVLADPSEIRDLAAAEPDLLRSLRRDLDVVRERAQGGVAHRVSRRALESDERAALRELGYIED